MILWFYTGASSATVTGMLTELEHMVYKNGLRKLIVLEKRCLKGYLIALCNYLVSGNREDGPKLFLGVHSKRARDSEHQLQQDKSQLDISRRASHWRWSSGRTGAQRGCRLSMLELYSKPTWVRPWVTSSHFKADPILSRGMDQRPEGSLSVYFTVSLWRTLVMNFALGKVLLLSVFWISFMSQ